jgi:uncharacterized membrane protein
MHTNQRRGRERLGTVDSWLSLVGGGALVAWGLTRGIQRRSAVGFGTAAGGGALLYNGLRSRRPHPRGVHIQTSFTINKPPEEVFRFWRNFENLPKFMSHLQSVKPTGSRYSRWVARGPMGATFSWDAEIVDERESEWIVWRSLAGSMVTNAGSVQFRKAPGNRGTEVTVSMQYEPIGGSVGKFVAALLGAEPERTLREELRRCKQLIEAGEIPTTEGQPHGRRSAVVSVLQKATRQPRPEMASMRTA